ncbi:MAG TPA: MFS transporter, partial [Chloroflexota bacterium]|nr:MFS transporter [Chloroflexota bacterium]
LGDLFGRRRMFVTGIVIFALASVACGLSQSLAQLIASRAVQGMGGALMTPESLAIISASFAGAERGRAIGTWSGFTSLASAAGPVIGGWLISAGSWRYAFFVNIPVALITLVLTRHIPESRDPEASGHLDWLGAGLATAGLGGVVYGFVTASTAGFARLDVVLSLLAGALALAAFVLAESRVAHPMMPLRLFKSRTFAGANLFTLLLYAALGGALFFLPFNLIQVHGYSPQAAGAALLPFVLLMFLLSRWSGGLVGRYGARLPLIVGPLVVALGYGLFALPGAGGSYWTTFFPAVVVLGLGMATSVAPLSTTVMDAVDSSHASTASGINNAVARTAGVLSLAVLGVVVVLAFGHTLDSRLDGLQLPAQVRQSVLDERGKLAAAEVPAGAAPAAAAQIRVAIQDSFVSGFRVAMAIAAGLAVSAGACAAVSIQAKRH